MIKLIHKKWLNWQLFRNSFWIIYFLVSFEIILITSNWWSLSLWQVVISSIFHSFTHKYEWESPNEIRLEYAFLSHWIEKIKQIKMNYLFLLIFYSFSFIFIMNAICKTMQLWSFVICDSRKLSWENIVFQFLQVFWINELLPDILRFLLWQCPWQRHIVY
jgi:hypothetical protein